MRIMAKRNDGSESNRHAMLGRYATTLSTRGSRQLLWQQQQPNALAAVIARSMSDAPAKSTTAAGAVTSQLPEHRLNNYQLVIVGTGWAGYQMFTQCTKHREDIEKVVGKPVDVVVVSKRNHFLYTPLLASTTVGTLEFRSIIEPIRDNHFRHEDDFHLATVTEIVPEDKFIKVQADATQRNYSVKYDTLVLACGSRPLTFGLPGVEEHAFFLKEIPHARAIRNRILTNFELAVSDGVSTEEKKKLLHFVVVGGGPTGVEFCAELYDFLQQDLVHKYPQTSKHLFVTLVDAGEILTGFDKHLREFALKKLKSRPSMRFVKKSCASVSEDGVMLNDGEYLKSGLVVWAAGVGPNDLTKSITNFEKSKRGNLLTNQYCQVLGAPEVESTALFGLPRRSNVFSIGDSAEIQDYPLPATAQKAQTQANYLTNLFRGKNPTPAAPYAFHSKGLLAYLGSYEGLFDSQLSTGGQGTLSGWKAWFLWRSAYLTKLGSWRLRLQVPIDWLKTMVVGRDLSRF